MAINNDRSLLEQQILSNSGLKGKELENLKARLATLSEQQLQAELSKSLSGNNKGEWYTGVMLEHNESVIMRNNHEQTTYTDDSGNEISELKDGDEVLERTIKSTDDKGNVFETTVTFSGGKPLTQIKSKNGNTTETTTYKYNDDADVPFVTVETKKADQSKVMTNVLEIDENGNFDNEDFIDRQTTSMDGTTTHIFTENNCVIEQQVKPNGKKIDTIYKGDSIEDYDNKKLHRVYQRTELKGEVHEVAYDGNGNTRTVVQNGESPSAIAKKFGVKESSLRRLNPARGKNAITQVGADIVVPGEYNADARVMTRRKSKQGAMQDFANDEVQRTAEKLYSSTMQEVTLDKDYKDAYSYARALLAADGVKNPSNQQINNKANEILVANGNIKFKKGTKVQIAEKAPDSKFVQDLSNNGFKPTRENAIFYNRFNALNPSQQQNVLSVIKYCRSQKITDPNKIKARILETFPEINLFDSGKLIPMNSFNTPAFQRKNPVALETFLTETLKLDLKSDVGRQVYERLASLPQEELGRINGSNFGDLSKSDFNDIANRFETSGVNIRTQMENQIELNRRNQQAERLGIPQQKFTSEMLANIYDRAADMMEEYYHNHGVFDAGTYLEGLKNITDWITPDNLFGIDMRSTLHVASDCRKAAQRFRQMHTDNPETFKREYAQLKKDGLVTADYNQQNVQEFMNLIQSGDVDINSDKFKNACKKAFGFKGVENTEKYIQTGQMAGNIGDIAVMLYTLGAASELKMMGKATQGVYGALERGAGRIMSKTAAQKTAKIGTSMAMGGTTLGGFTLGKETLNNLSNPMRDATSWETWKETGIASAESFGFGAFGGLLNETVVAPIVKAIEKPATKATQAVSKALTEQGELTGKQIMQTVSESGSLKLDGLFKINSQELANFARTAIAKGVGFGAEVTGFTAYEAGLDIIKDLIDPQTGRLPENITVDSLTEYLGDKFGEQFSNLGTIKGVSQLLMMSKGGKVAQKAMMNEILSKSDALKDIKFKKAEINGHEVYEVTYPNGNRAVVSSPEQAIATCQMAMQMEFLAKSLTEGEPKSEITRPQGMNVQEDALIQKARNNPLNRTSEHTEDIEINSDGTVTRKGVPAGISDSELTEVAPFARRLVNSEQTLINEKVIRDIEQTLTKRMIDKTSEEEKLQIKSIVNKITPKNLELIEIMTADKDISNELILNILGSCNKPYKISMLGLFNPVNIPIFLLQHNGFIGDIKLNDNLKRDYAKRLLTNKNVSKKSIPGILQNVEKGNSKLVDKALNSKNFDFNTLSAILRNTLHDNSLYVNEQKSVSNSRVKFAESLIDNPNFPNDCISDVVWWYGIENVNNKFLENLCNNKDFPPQQIETLIRNICCNRKGNSYMFNTSEPKFKQKLAERLIEDNNCPNEYVADIIGSIEKRQEVLFEQIYADKNIPKSEISSILYLDYGLSKGIEKLDLPNKIAILSNSASVSDLTLTYLKKYNIDKIKIDELVNKISMEMGLKKENIQTSEIYKQSLFKNYISNNSNIEETINNIDLNKYPHGIPMKYSRIQFTKDIHNLLSNLSTEDKVAVQSYFSINIENGKLEGFPIIPEQTKIIKKELLPVIEKIKEKIIDFTQKNETTINDPELKKILDSIIQGCPEFATIIGKTQHGTHQYTVDVHTLKVLQNIFRDPEYKNLDDESKTVLKFSVLLHDIGKKEGVIDKTHYETSAKYAVSILEKYKLSPREKSRIIETIYNHHWFEQYNKNEINANLVNAIFRTPKDLQLGMLMAKADLAGVSDDFHYKITKTHNQTDFNEYFDKKREELFVQQNARYKNLNLVMDTKFSQTDTRKFPTEKVSIKGKDIEIPVLNLTDEALPNDLYKYGFSKGVQRNNAKFFAHFNDRIKGLKVFMALSSSPTTESVQSLSMISLNNSRAFKNQIYGVITDIDMANVAQASNTNISSGYKKDLKNFTKDLYGFWQVNTYVRDNFINELDKAGISLTKEEYVELAKQIVNIQYSTQINKDIKIGNKIIPAELLQRALNESRDRLFDGDLHSEIVAINPRVKALVARVSSINECSTEFLELATENNLPIILIGHNEHGKIY